MKKTLILCLMGGFAAAAAIPAEAQTTIKLGRPNRQKGGTPAG